MRWARVSSLLLISLGHAQPTTQQYIHDLSSEDWRTRQSAQDALVDLGDAAAAALAATTQSAGDEETRSRAAAALAQIAENRAIGPSRITLHLHDAPSRQAFAELARQALAPLEPITPIFWQQSARAPVSIDCDRVPFWQAMQTLSDKTGVYLQEWGSGLRLSNGPLLAGPQCIDGSFLVIAESIERNQSVTYGPAADRVDRLSMNFTLMAEPKLRVLRATQAVDLREATDENGNSLLPDEKPPMQANVIGDTVRWNCSATLKYPPHNAGRRLTSLRGSVGVVLASRIERLTFPKSAPPRTAQTTADGVVVTLKSFARLNTNQTEVQLSIAPPGGMANHPDLNEQLSRPTAADLLDATGKPLAREYVQLGGDADHVDLTLRFSNSNGEDGTRAGEADRLLVQLVGATKQRVVAFEFKDLPLP